MAPVAADAGLSRESLYKALSGERNPSFDTILKVIQALGLRLLYTQMVNLESEIERAISRRIPSGTPSPP